MKKLISLFSPEQGEAIILMPLTRVLAETITNIGSLKIFPPGYLDLEPSDATATSRKKLTEAQSKITGFSFEMFEYLASVGFCYKIDSLQLKTHDHDSDITLLSKLAGFAERSFDLLRLNYCRLDLPDTLPGPVGVWDIATPYVGATIYFPDQNTWCEMAGAAASYASIVSGIGLDLDSCHASHPPSESDGEVGAIAAHALSLLSDAMHARNDTAKFVRCMTLLEFLGSPDEYKQWKKLKGEIACHIATNKSDYLNKIEELRKFTSLENERNEQCGYRTLVVHHGKFIEDILPIRNDRRDLFRKLQNYCHAVINDMIENSSMSWEEFANFRVQMKFQLGVA
jgi:hypothetical protein